MNEIEAARLRRIDQMNRDIHLAWQIESIKRQVKEQKVGKKTKVIMPELKKLLIPDEEKKALQTPGQMRGVLQQLSMRYGIPLRKVKAARGE